MNRWRACVGLVLLGLVLFPFRCPAPLVYRNGEGWSYESPGGKESAWRKLRAKDQLDVAQQAFDAKNYKLALKAAMRVVTIWPLSDYAPRGQYLVARCYEQKRQDERAFKAYQQVLTRFPKIETATEIQSRQFIIADRFLAGEWFKLFNYIPFFPSMEKTAAMFEDIVRFGPYGPYGASSQMKIGAAREKQKEYLLAVKAYEVAADRYAAEPKLAADAMYKAAMAYGKLARKADYDQSAANEAMSAFNDFMTLYPDDPRVPEAIKDIAALKNERARGNYSVAQFYEKEKRWDGALIYYNSVAVEGASSPLAEPARKRIAAIKQRQSAPASPGQTAPPVLETK
jgi:outer membrane protein assembly factor BamD